MSWILKNKKLVFVILFVLEVMCLTALSIKFPRVKLCTFIIFFVEVVVMYINSKVRNKMRQMHAPFTTKSNIRNVDYLVIGDCINAIECVPENKSYVQIAAPGRSEKSCYQILRHTHSILKENGGTVIFAFGNGKEEFTLFDAPFLHYITIKKYHLEGLKMKSAFPIIFAPIRAINMVFGGGYSTYTQVDNTDAELMKFCADRNYSLICYKKL